MRQLVLVSAIIAAFVLPATSRGQSMQEQLDELRRQVEELRAGQQQMTDLLTQIQSVLGGGARRAAPAARRGVPRAPQGSSDFDLTDVSVMGSDEAPVTIIEFSDFECPYCARHFETVLPLIKKELVDTGKARYAFVNMPLPIHENAFFYSEAALCSGEQGKFWEMHDLLFQEQKTLSQDLLAGLGQRLGLDESAYRDCLVGRVFQKKVSDQFDLGYAAGLEATPTFYVGRTNPESKTVRGERYLRGVRSFEEFRRIVEQLSGESGSLVE